jgi:nucleoid-associated protein YgaU
MATLPTRPRPQQIASNNTSEAPVLPRPHVDMPTAPKAPAATAPKAMAKPQLPVVHHTAPLAGAARETAMSLPSRPRKPIQTAAKPESSEREPIAISVPKQPKAMRASTAAAPRAGSGYYQVKPGDSLSKLAQRYLGSAKRWPELYAMNKGRVSNPRMIRVGQVLAMPGAGGSLASGKTRVYVVRPGDSLFKIAGQQLGNATRWSSIYDANRNHIRDARMIFPGQKLFLPV